MENKKETAIHNRQQLKSIVINEMMKYIKENNLNTQEIIEILYTVAKQLNSQMIYHNPCIGGTPLPKSDYSKHTYTSFTIG